ncbi:MAG: hypothetical protein FIA94_10400 [Nitrospirae bacterium]|nr:hypothetical protein [Nitrospirota bacterium]
MKRSARIFIHTACLVLILSCVSCTPGVRLSSQSWQGGVSGTYTVIYYGCNFSEDLETVVFLDREGDQYTIEPFAPDFKYRVKKGVDARDAFSHIEGFLRCSTAFQGSQVKRIIAPNGQALGYEVRPVYAPFVYGAGDVLNVDYWLNGDKAVAYIRLDPTIERLIYGGSSVIDE